MSSTRIDDLVDETQAAFDRRPDDIEPGIDVDDAALLQLHKVYRLLAGADTLHEVGFSITISLHFRGCVLSRHQCTRRRDV